jgi:hypothetical protein
MHVGYTYRYPISTPTWREKVPYNADVTRSFKIYFGFPLQDDTDRLFMYKYTDKSTKMHIAVLKYLAGFLITFFYDVEQFLWICCKIHSLSNALWFKMFSGQI